jgi:hypothetical protein
VTEGDILDMQYDLLKHRGLQPVDDVSSMTLLYFYSKYRKDREDARNANTNLRTIRVGGR